MPKTDYLQKQGDFSGNRETPGDSRSWESPEKADNVWWLFIQILLR